MAKILFVDDDPYTLETFNRAVEVFGHQALLAGSAQEALKLVSKETPDMIFIDMVLPDMDGLTLVKRLNERATISEIPILVLSAGPELDASERAKAAGARDYLSKPIRLQALLETIRTYTGE